MLGRFSYFGLSSQSGVPTRTGLQQFSKLVVKQSNLRNCYSLETIMAAKLIITCMIGDRVHISAMMQPAPHMSTAGP